MNKLRDALLIAAFLIVMPLAAFSLLDALRVVEAQTPPGEPCLVMPDQPLLTEWNERRLWMAVGRPSEITVLRYDTHQTFIMNLDGVPIELAWDYQIGLTGNLYIVMHNGAKYQWNMDSGELHVISLPGNPDGTPDSEAHDGGDGGNIGAGGLDETPVPPLPSLTPTCVPEKKVSMAYTNEKKAIAVAVVHRHGGKVSGAALEEIRVVIDEPNLPAKTVRRWLQEVNKSAQGQNVPEMSPLKKGGMSPAVKTALEKADGALDRVFEDITRVYAQKVLLAAATEEIKAKDAMTIVGIAYDKHRLAAGLPTEIIRILPALIQKLEQSGLSPSETFNSMIAELDAEKAIVEDDSGQ